MMGDLLQITCMVRVNSFIAWQHGDFSCTEVMSTILELINL